jgi:peptidyl-prolyl cis-trans isomerase D
MDMPNFQDETGNFSKIILNNILIGNNLSEQSFIDLLKGDFIRQNMLSPVAANSKAPETLVDILFQYRAEQRSAEIIYIPNAKFEIKETPDENALKVIYNNNLEKFKAPEYRKIEALLVKASDLVPLSSITQEEIETFYNDNLSRYRTEPTRTVEQIIFNSQEEALNAFSNLNNNETLKILKNKINIPEIIDLGKLTINDLTGFDLTPIFGRNTKGVLQPVQTDFGWHIFEITDLSVGSVKALPVVKDEIINFIRDDKALDEMYEATVYMEDLLAAGSSMKEISQTPSYSMININFINRDGVDIDGLKIDIPVETERFLNLAFGAEENIDSQIIETDEYAYILRVTSIQPSAPKSYDKVNDEIKTIWKRNQIRKKIEQKVKSIQDLIGPSSNIFEITENDDMLEFAKLGPLRRFGDSLMVNYIIPRKFVSPQLMNKLFKANINDVINAEVEEGHIIAKLKEIIKPDPVLFAETKLQIKNSISTSMGDSIVSNFSSAITDDYDIVINQEAISLLTPE